MQNNSMTGKTVTILAESGPVGSLAEPVIQAILDIAYLLGNLDGWFSEKQDQYFEIIVAGLGKKPADVSPDAVGLNAKLAHLRGKVSEEELLHSFSDGVRADCRAFGGVPASLLRRAFSLWIALALADGRITPVCREALERLELQFRRFGSFDDSAEFLRQAETLLLEAGALELQIDGEDDQVRCTALQEQYQTKLRTLLTLISVPSPAEYSET